MSNENGPVVHPEHALLVGVASDLLEGTKKYITPEQFMIRAAELGINASMVEIILARGEARRAQLDSEAWALRDMDREIGEAL
ncbi:MAG: hypothetical protein JWO47_366 [Candidatus Saccharibacteria bacterium]|nr:hypothetical protein [Candidatus Saccharibacteria bacterium]